MRLLLDSSVFIWFDLDDDQLSQRVREAIDDKSNRLYVSLASVWEIQIKVQLGKLRLNSSLENAVSMQQQTNGIELLPIELNHILALNNLPTHHRDPFDRMLIAQAQAAGLTLVTRDPKIRMCNVTTLW